MVILAISPLLSMEKLASSMETHMLESVGTSSAGENAGIAGTKKIMEKRRRIIFLGTLYTP